MNRKEIIKYIRKIKKDIKGNKQTKIYCGVHFGNSFHSLEIAARFLRRIGFNISIETRSLPIGLVKSNGYSIDISRYAVIKY